MPADMCCLARISATGEGGQGRDGQRERAAKVRVMLPCAGLWTLHCHNQVSYLCPCFVVEVSIGRPLRFDAVCGRVAESPPFLADNETAVDFLKAVIESDVGTGIVHTVKLSEDVVVQLYKFLCGEDLPKASSFGQRGMPALYLAFALISPSLSASNAGL
eukprot:2149820-Pleurochrysis_carterae.AAC.4